MGVKLSRRVLGALVVCAVAFAAHAQPKQMNIGVASLCSCWLPLYVADYPAFMPQHQVAIGTVARQSEVHFVPALPQRDAPVSVTPSGKVMLHIEIDRAAEKARLTREVEKIESDLEKQRAKLGNPAFAERAPAAVVEQARKLLAETEARHADLRGQLGKLG